MHLEKIITLANVKTRVQFLAMERSLRAVGCHLPIWVIPYDDDKFDLPENSVWWEISEILDWLVFEKTHPTMRKYQCLLERNYQFVDTDVIFLSSPEVVLASYGEFITSCCHWHNPGQTQTEDSLRIYKSKTTIWQRRVFNTGQFACSRVLYTLSDLKETASNSLNKFTCLRNPWNEQPGLNLLILESGVEVVNLTLPPTNMESTWAGDYADEFLKYWEIKDKMPYIIHWAGQKATGLNCIDQLFYQYLTDDEAQEYQLSLKHQNRLKWNPLNRCKKAIKAFKEI